MSQPRRQRQELRVYFPSSLNLEPCEHLAKIRGRGNGFGVDGGESSLLSGIPVDGADVALQAVFAGERLIADLALIAGFSVSVDEVAMPN